MTGAAGYGPYSASKEAIRSLTRTAAGVGPTRHPRELRLPGVGRAPNAAGGRRPRPRAAAYASMYADHPLGRDGDPELDIAPVVAFLLSDDCRYVNGETIMVDGGGMMRA